MAKVKDVIILDIVKEKQDIFLKINIVDKTIEEYFRKIAIMEHGANEKDFIQTSEKWVDREGNGLKFYKNNKELQANILKTIDGKYNSGEGDNKRSLYITNDFGSSLYDKNGRLNIAILRAVGASSPQGLTLKTTELIPWEECRTFIEQLAAFLKEFYKAFLKKSEGKFKIQIEV